MPESGVRVVQVGTIDWLNQWVGHARPGARQMIGPVADTHLISEGVGKRCQALVGAGLIIATWKAVAPAGSDARWEWRLIRTGRDLPAVWPLLVAPRGVGSAAGPARTVTATDIVFKMIMDAAMAGHPAPTNADIVNKTPVESTSSASSLISSLAKQGRIAVKGAGANRVIAIPSLGIETAKVPA